MRNFYINDKGQAQALSTIKLIPKDFENNNHIGVYWLGGGGAMINSFGTIIMIDPLLEGFDMPLLIDMVAEPRDVTKVDGYFVSHVDNDHYSRPTLKHLAPVTREVHTSHYVASLMKDECEWMHVVILGGMKWISMMLILNSLQQITIGKMILRNLIIEYGLRKNIAVSM